MRRAVLLAIGLSASACVALALAIHVRYSMDDMQLSVMVMDCTTEQIPETTSYNLEKVEYLPPAWIKLPYAVEGTTLLAERIVSYDGPYLEDGSNTEVSNISALILRNIGSSGVERAEIVLMCNQQKLVFEATMIPPDATVVVLERDQQRYVRTQYTSCYGWAVGSDAGWTFPDMLDIREVDMGTLEVTNITDKPMQNIKLYYKAFLPGRMYYVGGITLEKNIQSLEPGEMVQLHPAHYAQGYSKILRVAFQ